MRRPILMHQRQPTGGARPNATQNSQTNPRRPCRELLFRQSPLSRVGTSRQSRKSLQFAPLPSSSGESRLMFKAAVKQVALNLFPDATLKFLSIRSRRQIERKVHELGLDTVARQISRENDGRVASGPFRGMRLDLNAFPVHVFGPMLLGTYEQE